MEKDGELTIIALKYPNSSAPIPITTSRIESMAALAENIKDIKPVLPLEPHRVRIYAGK